MAAPRKNSIRTWAYSLLGLIFISVGGAVYVKARQRTAASAFYVFCISTASALAVALAAILGDEWLLTAMFSIMVIWAGSFAIFFFKFPVRIGKLALHHNLAIAAVVASGAAIIGAYFWRWNSPSGEFGWVQPLYYIYLAGCVVAGLVSLGRSLVAERSPEIRRQLVLLLGGTAMAVGPNVILGLLPSLLIDRPIVHIETTALALGIMPLAFAYAITQHQMLGIRSLVRRGVVYVVTGFTVLFIFSIGAATLRAAMPEGWDSSEVGLLSFAAFVFLIALSFGYMQRRVEHMVDRYIYHDAYDYKDALLQFSAQLAAEQNLHVLSDQLVERTCRLMNLSCGVLLLAVQPEGLGSGDWGPGAGGQKAEGRRQGAERRSGESGEVGDMPNLITGPFGELRAGSFGNRLRGGPFDTVTRLRLPAELDGSNGGLIPYAKFGKAADWLMYGLREKLSELGISLQEPGPTSMNIQVFQIDETSYQGPGTRDQWPVSLKGTLTSDLPEGNPAEGNPSQKGEEGKWEAGDVLLPKGNPSLRSGQAGAKGDPEGGDGQVIEAFLGVPLWTRSRFMGMLCLGEKKTGERFSKDDLSLLSTLGSQAALAIYNAQLYETREQALLDTITALAHAIEAKDNYTINHCEKITGRAVALAESMGLTRQEIENIRLGSILHDVGKIGIPDAILNKPSKLTEEEYAVIKEHAAIGARIVSSVGALKGVVPIVRHHQEKYDGSGYPEGLRGEEIPIGARIIGVVDTYGAMTEDRVYRRAPGHEAAIGEIKRFAGRQFDPKVVEAFVRLLEDQPELAEL